MFVFSEFWLDGEREESLYRRGMYKNDFLCE